MRHHGEDSPKHDWPLDNQETSDLYMLNCYDIWSATPARAECFDSHGDQVGEGCAPRPS